jgi:hypothetical protein
VLPAGRIRSFIAYWITMLAAGSFMFCCRLGLKGFAALSCFPDDDSASLTHLLPR